MVQQLYTDIYNTGTTSEAMTYRRPLMSSETLEGFLSDFETEIPPIRNDVFLSPLLIKAKHVLFGN